MFDTVECGARHRRLLCQRTTPIGFWVNFCVLGTHGSRRICTTSCDPTTILWYWSCSLWLWKLCPRYVSHAFHTRPVIIPQNVPSLPDVNNNHRANKPIANLCALRQSTRRIMHFRDRRRYYRYHCLYSAQSRADDLAEARAADTESSADRAAREAMVRRLDNERQYLKSQLQTEITCKDELREALAKATRQLGDIKVGVFCTSCATWTLCGVPRQPVVQVGRLLLAVALEAW